jgi:hypothetical protein
LLPEENQANGSWLAAQAALGLFGNLALLAPPAVLLVWSPADSLSLVSAAAAPEGWAVFLLGLLAAGWLAERTRRLPCVHELGAVGVGLGILLACSAAAQFEDSWLGYHVLWGTWALFALAMLCGLHRRQGIFARSPVNAILGWLLAFGALSFALSLRAIAADPAGPWAALAGLLVGVLLAGAFALQANRRSLALPHDGLIQE